MHPIFYVRPRSDPGEPPRFEVIAGSANEAGILIASHPIAGVAADLALLLNRLVERYAADSTDQVARELTWDLLFRLDIFAPKR